MGIMLNPQGSRDGNEQWYVFGVDTHRDFCKKQDRASSQSGHHKKNREPLQDKQNTIARFQCRDPFPCPIESVSRHSFSFRVPGSFRVTGLTFSLLDTSVMRR